jgi:hypothetical protein
LPDNAPCDIEVIWGSHVQWYRNVFNTDGSSLEDAVNKAHTQNTDTKLTTDGTTSLIDAGVLKANMTADALKTIDGRVLSVDGTKLDGIEALADVTDAVNVGTSIHGAADKNPPIDADKVPLIDTAASNVLKTSTWTNIKAFLKTYFDTLYGSIGSSHTQGTDTALGAVGTKNPPIDADKALYRDSTASDALVTSTWTQVKAFLKTYFDTIYTTGGTGNWDAGLVTDTNNTIIGMDLGGVT